MSSSPLVPPNAQRTWFSEISQRRNGHLRQMYEMLKGDQDVGRMLSGEPRPEDPGPEEFLDQFDLKNG